MGRLKSWTTGAKNWTKNAAFALGMLFSGKWTDYKATKQRLVDFETFHRSGQVIAVGGLLKQLNILAQTNNMDSWEGLPRQCAFLFGRLFFAMHVFRPAHRRLRVALGLRDYTSEDVAYLEDMYNIVGDNLNDGEDRTHPMQTRYYRELQKRQSGRPLFIVTYAQQEQIADRMTVSPAAGWEDAQCLSMDAFTKRYEDPADPFFRPLFEPIVDGVAELLARSIQERRPGVALLVMALTQLDTVLQGKDKFWLKQGFPDMFAMVLPAVEQSEGAAVQRGNATQAS